MKKNIITAFAIITILLCCGCFVVPEFNSYLRQLDNSNYYIASKSITRDKFEIQYVWGGGTSTYYSKTTIKYKTPGQDKLQSISNLKGFGNYYVNSKLDAIVFYGSKGIRYYSPKTGIIEIAKKGNCIRYEDGFAYWPLENADAMKILKWDGNIDNFVPKGKTISFKNRKYSFVITKPVLPERKNVLWYYHVFLLSKEDKDIEFIDYFRSRTEDIQYYHDDKSGTLYYSINEYYKPTETTKTYYPEVYRYKVLHKYKNFINRYSSENNILSSAGAEGLFVRKPIKEGLVFYRFGDFYLYKDEGEPILYKPEIGERVEVENSNYFFVTNRIINSDYKYNNYAVALFRKNGINNICIDAFDSNHDKPVFFYDNNSGSLIYRRDSYAISCVQKDAIECSVLSRCSFISPIKFDEGVVFSNNRLNFLGVCIAKWDGTVETTYIPSDGEKIDIPDSNYYFLTRKIGNNHNTDLYSTLLFEKNKNEDVLLSSFVNRSKKFFYTYNKEQNSLFYQINRVFKNYKYLMLYTYKEQKVWCDLKEIVYAHKDGVIKYSDNSSAFYLCNWKGKRSKYRPVSDKQVNIEGSDHCFIIEKVYNGKYAIGLFRKTKNDMIFITSFSSNSDNIVYSYNKEDEKLIYGVNPSETKLFYYALGKKKSLKHVDTLEGKVMTPVDNGMIFYAKDRSQKRLLKWNGYPKYIKENNNE